MLELCFMFFHSQSNTHLWVKKGNFIYKVPEIKQLNNWGSCFNCVHPSLCQCRFPQCGNQGLLQIKWWLGRSEVEGSDVLLCASLPTGKRRVKVVLFVPLHSAPKTVCHLLPMRRLFIPPIPLGKNSSAMHYLVAVWQSVICYSVPLSTA